MTQLGQSGVPRLASTFLEDLRSVQPRSSSAMNREGYVALGIRTLILGEMNWLPDDEGAEEPSEVRSGEAVARFDEVILAVAERALRTEEVALNENPEEETLDELPGKPQRE